MVGSPDEIKRSTSFTTLSIQTINERGSTSSFKCSPPTGGQKPEEVYQMPHLAVPLVRSSDENNGTVSTYTNATNDDCASGYNASVNNSTVNETVTEVSNWNEVALIFWCDRIWFFIYVIIYTLQIVFIEDDNLKLFIYFFHATFILLELAKMPKCHSIPEYFLHALKVIRMINVILAILSSNICSIINFCPQLKAISIILTWLDLCFTVGEIPFLAPYLAFLKKAILNSLKFLAVYSMIIIGYALGFNILSQSDGPIDALSNVLKFLFETLLMFNSDIDADKKPFDSSLNRLILISFKILVNIALPCILAKTVTEELHSVDKEEIEKDIIKYYKKYYPGLICCKNRKSLKSINH